jgi:hypothetical protein
MCAWAHGSVGSFWKPLDSFHLISSSDTPDFRGSAAELHIEPGSLYNLLIKVSHSAYAAQGACKNTFLHCCCLYKQQCKNPNPNPHTPDNTCCWDTATYPGGSATPYWNEKTGGQALLPRQWTLLILHRSTETPSGETIDCAAGLRVSQPGYLKTVHCKGSQYISAILVKHPDHNGIWLGYCWQLPTSPLVVGAAGLRTS